MNDPGWSVRLATSARRDIKRLDPPVRERILAAIDGLRSQPPTGDIKRLTGHEPPEWRLRHRADNGGTRPRSDRKD